MKIKDFLENFNGDNHIKIYDSYDFSTHRYNHVQEAISSYGYFTVKSWDIVDGVLKITIRSQF
jgi:hypothetical protein